jgi:hypothetical protein
MLATVKNAALYAIFPLRLASIFPVQIDQPKIEKTHSIAQNKLQRFQYSSANQRLAPWHKSGTLGTQHSRHG